MTEPLLSPQLMRQLDRLAVVGRRPHAGALAGDRRSPKRGASVEFADFRAYAPGDDFRQIDWNTYARLERFFLKLFVAEEDTTVHVLVDVSRSMTWGDPPKIAFARRVAAAIGYMALADQDRVALGAFDVALIGRPRETRGRRRLGSFLAEVEAIGTAPDADPVRGGTDLAAAVRAHAATVRRRGPLVLLSDLYDPGWREAFRAAIGARFDVTAIHVLSPEEIDPRLDGDMRLIDDETGQTVEIGIDEEARRRYGEALGAWRAELAEWCRRRGVPYVPVTSDASLESFVTEALRRHGVVA